MKELNNIKQQINYSFFWLDDLEYKHDVTARSFDSYSYWNDDEIINNLMITIYNRLAL